MARKALILLLLFSLLTIPIGILAGKYFGTRWGYPIAIAAFCSSVFCQMALVVWLLFVYKPTVSQSGEEYDDVLDHQHLPKK